MSVTQGPPGTDPFVDHPALSGCMPAGLGRRAAARALDFVFGSTVGVLISLPTLLSSPDNGRLEAALGFAVLSQVLMVVLTVAVYWYLGRTGFLPGGRMLGIRQVRFDTGAAPGWSGLVKYLLIAVVAGVTFGIGYLVTILVLKPPLRRGWHDQISGLIVLDIRAGRDPVTTRSDVSPATAAQQVAASVAGAPALIVPVGGGSTGPVGAQGWTEGPTTLRPQAPTPGVWSPPGVAVPSAAPLPSTPAPPVNPAAEEPLIGAVPWRTASSPERVHASSAPPASPAVGAEAATAPATSTRPVIEAVPRADEDLTETRLAVTPTTETMVLAGDLGEHIAVAHPIALGRNPSPPAAHPDARPIALQDPTMSISKTHAVVGPGDNGIWVVDLHSTNGTAIVTSTGMRQSVPAGGRVLLQPGAELRLGQRVFQVVRS